MNSIITSIIDVLAGYLKIHHTARTVTAITSGLLLTVCAFFGLYVFFNIAVLRIPANIFLQNHQFILSTILITGVMSAIFFRAALGSFLPKRDAELEPIRKEREEIRDRIKEREPDIFDTIQLNLNQLSEYYTINKSQARNSFRASITAIIVGFITIISGIWFFYISERPNPSLTYVTVIGGVMLQFIGGAYFYLYNKSLIQLNFFFARLTVMQDTMLSIKLCDQITEVPMKIKILEHLIFEIITRDASIRKYVAEGTELPRKYTPVRRAGKAKAKAKGPLEEEMKSGTPTSHAA